MTKRIISIIIFVFAVVWGLLFLEKTALFRKRITKGRIVDHEMVDRKDSVVK